MRTREYVRACNRGTYVDVELLAVVVEAVRDVLSEGETPCVLCLVFCLVVFSVVV